MVGELDRRIRDLSTRVDHQFRDALRSQVRTLRDAGHVRAVLLVMSPLSLQLLRQVYHAAGQIPPSDNLYDCIVQAAGGDPARKVPGLRILPDEIATGLHTIRTLSNKADHAVERVRLTVADAEAALALFLRAIEWFYCEYPNGPRFDSIQDVRAGRLRRPLAIGVGFVGLVAAAGVLVACIANARAPGGPPAVLTAKTPGPPESRPALGGPNLGGLLAHGTPPGDASAHPRLALQLLVDRGRGGHFEDLKDGDPVASEVDDYLVVARTISAGYLYIFQVDSLGHVAWLFPANRSTDLSSGSNPLAASETIQVPPAEQKTALYLDRNRGVEHIYAVFSAARWPELETRLAASAGQEGGAERVVDDHVALGEKGHMRGVKGSRPVAVPVTVERDNILLTILGREYEASGSFLIVERRFRHE